MSDVPDRCPKCGRDTYIKMKVKASDLSFDETVKRTPFCKYCGEGPYIKK